MLYSPIIEQLAGLPIYKKDSKLVLSIPKNGNSTLNHWHRKGGYERRSLSDDPKWAKHGLEREQQYEVTVFLRDPIDRFWAGATTAFYHHFCNKDKNPELFLFYLRSNLFLDKHVFPQMFYLMLLYDNCPYSTLTFHHYKRIGSVLGTDIHSNKTNSNKRKVVEKAIRDFVGNGLEEKLIEAYQPDQFLFDTFMGKTVGIDKVLKRLKKEISAKYIIGRNF